MADLSELLERHRPLLRYDSQDPFRACSALTIIENPGNKLLDKRGEPIAVAGDADRMLDLKLLGDDPQRAGERLDEVGDEGEIQRDAVHMQGDQRYADRVYGRALERGGTTYLQYWFWLYYNPKDVAGRGRHEGDWELVQLRVDERGSPEVATLAQHTWAEGCRWEELERPRVGDHEAPVIYVANGSHANYAHAGTHDRPFPDPNDEADGKGRRVRPRLQVIGEARPGWVPWPGRWGRSRAGIVPGEQSSPRGPRFQDDDPWARPASFHRRRARACGSGPPGRPWQTAAVLALLLAGAGAAIALRRHRA